MTSSPIASALAHVRDKSLGGPLSASAAVTINFHPDALHEGGG